MKFLIGIFIFVFSIFLVPAQVEILSEAVIPIQVGVLDVAGVIVDPTLPVNLNLTFNTFVNNFDQSLNTTDNVQFNNVTITGFFNGLFSWTIEAASQIYLSFTGSVLSFNETRLNQTIDDRANVNITGANPFDQVLNTTSNVTFNNITLTGNLAVLGNITGNQYYSEIFNVNETSVLVDIVTAGVFVQIPDLQLGERNGFTFTNQNLTPQFDGVYFGSLTGSITGAANTDYQLGVSVNGVVQNKSITELTIVTAGRISNIALTTITNLTAGDNITVVATVPSEPPRDMAYTRMSLELVRIGN